MTFPAVVAVLVLCIVTAMLLFIIPMFQDLYTQLGGKLPLPTQVLINVSKFARKLWFLIFGDEAAAVVAFRKWIATDEGRKKWDVVKLRVPVLGSLVRKTAL